VIVSKKPTIDKATLDDLLAIPEEKRNHEIIDGALYEKDATHFRHGSAQSRLSGVVAPYDRKPGGRAPGGWWFASETECFLAADQIYKPDLAGWRRERLPEPPEKWLVRVVPDFVCEILSTNKRHDLVEKKRGYHRAHVGHYWIVDPVDQTLTVHRWHEDGYLEVLVAERGQTVRAEPFDAINLFVGVLFGDDPPDE
jgi:Uma2 family endonuclease